MAQALEIAADAPAAREVSAPAYVAATAFEHCLLNALLEQAAKDRSEAADISCDRALASSGGACPGESAAEFELQSQLLRFAAGRYAERADGWWSIWCHSGEHMSRKGVYP